MKKILFCILLIPLLFCSKKQEALVVTSAIKTDTVVVANIYLLPYEDVSKKEVEILKIQLEKKFSELLSGKRIFTILNAHKLPKEAFIKERNRYKSTELMNYERSLLKGKEIIIGLTHKDICANIHGKSNYGIIGNSRPNRQVCIVSDKRLSNKSDFWKPIIHEFIHTYYGAKHCKNDDDLCLMQDAKGKGNFKIKNKLCNSCFSFIKNQK